MSENFKETAKSIIELSGGKTNIYNALHCATRVRFNIKNFEFVNIDGLKEVPRVLGVMKVGDQLQIIIGADVNAVFDEVALLLNEGTEENEPEALSDKSKKIFLNP